MPWQRRPRPLHFYVYCPHEGGTTVTEQSNSARTAPPTSETNGRDGSAASMPESSRRHFLKASAALAAGVTAAQALPEAAMAQGASDVELNRVLQQRRILLKGGVVLTLDRGVGDFAQADVLIEDGKIREVRPNMLRPSTCRVGS